MDLRKTQEIPAVELEAIRTFVQHAPKSYRMEHYDTELRTTAELPAVSDPEHGELAANEQASER
jgi:hypothetical protein